MLEIKGLHVEIEGKAILKGIDLTLAPGTIHVLMGPNGVGKSTLAKVILGDPAYEVIRGEIVFEGKNLLEMETDERARAGLFWSFQDPIEIPGLTSSHFLRTAAHLMRAAQGEVALTEEEFAAELGLHLQRLRMDPERLKRGLNEGFSGGEKKKNEVLQHALLRPTCSIFDEIDSGLDVDALQLVCAALRSDFHSRRTYLFITHYTRMLRLIQPHHVHVLVDGKIALSGDAQLAHEIEERGYDDLIIASR